MAGSWNLNLIFEPETNWSKKVTTKTTYAYPTLINLHLNAYECRNHPICHNLLLIQNFLHIKFQVMAALNNVQCIKTCTALILPRWILHFYLQLHQTLWGTIIFKITFTCSVLFWACKSQCGKILIVWRSSSIILMINYGLTYLKTVEAIWRFFLASTKV